MSEILKLRQNYQQQVCEKAIFLKRGMTPSIADIGSQLSKALSNGIFEEIGYDVSLNVITGQTAGKNFETATKDFVEAALNLLSHLRPGKWQFSVQGDISHFEQYQHIAELNELIRSNKQVHAALGDYVVKPDVVVARMPVTDEEINRDQLLVDPQNVPRLTPLRQANTLHPKPILLDLMIEGKRLRDIADLPFDLAI